MLACTLRVYLSRGREPGLSWGKSPRDLQMLVYNWRLVVKGTDLVGEARLWQPFGNNSEIDPGWCCALKCFVSFDVKPQKWCWGVRTESNTLKLSEWARIQVRSVVPVPVWIKSQARLQECARDYENIKPPWFIDAAHGFRQCLLVPRMDLAVPTSSHWLGKSQSRQGLMKPDVCDCHCWSVRELNCSSCPDQPNPHEQEDGETTQIISAPNSWYLTLCFE